MQAFFDLLFLLGLVDCFYAVKSPINETQEVGAWQSSPRANMSYIL